MNNMTTEQQVDWVGYLHYLIQINASEERRVRFCNHFMHTNGTFTIPISQNELKINIAPKNKPFIDKHGYYRIWDDKRDLWILMHRKKAYEEIYLKHKDEYTMKFSKYVVHHKNENKKDNRAVNLRIMTRSAHELLHDNYSNDTFHEKNYHGHCQDCGKAIDDKYTLCYECNRS